MQIYCIYRNIYVILLLTRKKECEKKECINKELLFTWNIYVILLSARK